MTPLPGDLETAARILELEDGGRVDDPEGLLRHPDPRVRARAVLAAGRGGWPDRHATLLTLLRDEHAPVRAAAAFSLGELRFDLEPPLAVARRERAAAALAARLSDVPEVALAASLALGELGVASSALGELLQGRPEEVTPEVAAAALWAHGRAPGGTAVPVLGWLDHADVRVRLAAAGALVETGDPNALPPLASLLDDAEPVVRAAAARGLADRAASLLDRRLDGLLEERSPEVAVAALAHLESAWSPEDTGPGRLAQVLRRSLDRNLHVRRAALAALGSVAGRRGAAADRLLRALEEPEPVVRAAALRALTVAGEELADLGLEWAHERWRGDPADGAPLAGVEAAALAQALARSDRQRDLIWLRELADSAEGPLREAAYPRLVEADPATAMELARRWLRGPVDAGTGWALWGALQLVRAHGLPGESARPALVDDAWAVVRSSSSRRESRLRAMALELIDALAPTLLERRMEYLAGLPWRDVRLTVQRLRHSWPESERPVTVVEPGEYLRAARRVLAAQDRPPTLRLTSERGNAVIRVRADRAPLAALDVLDRVGPATGADLTVRGGMSLEGVVSLDAGEWPRQPGWPAAAIPALAEPGMVRRDRSRGATDAGTWALLARTLRGPAGEAWGEVEEGLRLLSRLQPGDRVRLRSEEP